MFHALRIASFWHLLSALTLAFLPFPPLLGAPRRLVLLIVRSYLAAVLWLLRRVAGLSWEVHGDVAAARAPVPVAAKHQSAFETIVLQYLLRDPAIATGLQGRRGAIVQRLESTLHSGCCQFRAIMAGAVAARQAGQDRHRIPARN